MIVRRLSGSHFDGLRTLEAGPLPRVQAAAIDLPEACDAGVVARLLRFAVCGAEELSRSPLDPDAGFTFAEVELEAAHGGTFSLFRGIDRHGREQVSLREAEGPTVHAGPTQVRKRLTEILGASPTDWARAALAVDPDCAPPADEPTLPDAPGAVRKRLTPSDVERLRSPVDEAVLEFQRAAAAAHLAFRATTALDALVALGGRLRRARTDTSVELGRLGAERERVRSRLRRVEEYRALVEQADDLLRRQPAVRGASTFQRVTLAALTASFAGLLLWMFTGDEPALHAADLRGLATLGFVGAFTAFLLATFRRAEAPHPTSTVWSSMERRDEWRASLRARFTDVGDPDRPELTGELRARISELQHEMAPAQAALERLDETLAVHDVELGRACRALQHPVPAARESASALLPDEGIDAVASQIARLGDEVYQATMEREALIAGGALAPSEALDRLIRAALHFADELGVPDGAEAPLARVVRPTFAGDFDDAASTAATRFIERLAGALRDVERLAARETVPGLDPQAVPRQAARELLADPCDDTTRDVAAVLCATHSDAVSRWTDGAWESLGLDDGGLLVLSGPSGAVTVSGLPRAARERLAFGLRLLLHERGVAARPALRLFTRIPRGFAGGPDLAAYVSACRGAPTQVLLVSSAATATPVHDDAPVAATELAFATSAPRPAPAPQPARTSTVTPPAAGSEPAPAAAWRDTRHAPLGDAEQDDAEQDDAEQVGAEEHLGPPQFRPVRAVARRPRRPRPQRLGPG